MEALILLAAKLFLSLIPWRRSVELVVIFKNPPKIIPNSLKDIG